MKTALVVGATGLIGKHLTIKLLASNFYTKVKVLVRKPLEIKHPNLEQIVVDFDNLDTSKIIADDVFCCLGTTMKKAGSKPAFYKVDFTYPLEIAKAALVNGAKQYLIVTAMGADERSMFYYNRVKGEIEKALSDLRYPTLLIFRPSMLIGEREEPRLGEKIGEKLMNLFSFLIPEKYQAIKGEKVAEAMLILAQKGIKNKDIFESGTLQNY
ncbi:oxidoreductase [Emticicia sp. SJ17W-69]|uniref:oxidoreductase n=1 Tax=Emticicia sp. SJ17W-69 TaxID=3421657 RepID=UPI003EBCAD46